MAQVINIPKMLLGTDPVRWKYTFQADPPQKNNFH